MKNISVEGSSIKALVWDWGLGHGMLCTFGLWDWDWGTGCSISLVFRRKSRMVDVATMSEEE